MIYQIQTSCIIEVLDIDKLSENDKKTLQLKIEQSIIRAINRQLKDDLLFQSPVTVNVDQIVDA